MKVNTTGLAMVHTVLWSLDSVEDESPVFLRLRARLPPILSDAQASKNIRPALFGRLKEMAKAETPTGWLHSLWCMVRCAVQNDVAGTRLHAGRVLRAVMAPTYLGNLPAVVAAQPYNSAAVAQLAAANAALDSFVNAKLSAAL